MTKDNWVGGLKEQLRDEILSLSGQGESLFAKAYYKQSCCLDLPNISGFLICASLISKKQRIKSVRRLSVVFVFHKMIPGGNTVSLNGLSC